ncbi:VOC family protein [uncultured Pseudacidovorax sp.]|uniref:VOC family protein n=1 Tax=uncultured Pseudacidovorax sp. TaxID=679313 RepID=UPI0025CDA16B|nr:VOC family protein [uncultured Pseudacidovorax sp.]
MISHVFLGTSDFERALAFYQSLLAALGLQQRFIERDHPWAGWQQPGVARPLLLLGRPYDRQPAVAGNGAMLALLAESRRQVDEVHALALRLGGRCEGPPGLRPHYHANYYGAYFRDLDGNKLGLACHTPEGGGPIQSPSTHSST